VNVAAHLNELAQPNEMVVSQVAIERMPSDYKARAGASEACQLKRVGGEVEFRRLNLLGL
jgi:class 3 adenylate cyclase